MEAMTDRILRGAGAEELGGLFARLAGGDGSALEPLYDAWSGRLFGLALWRTGSRDDAGEVVQEVFLRLVEKRDALAGVRDPASWLLAVAHRIALNVARRERRRAAEPLERCAFVEAPSGDAARRLDAERASTLLAQLPPAQREAIYLHDFAGCTFSEIGTIAGVPTFTAASRYRLGVGKLRRLMEEVR